MRNKRKKNNRERQFYKEQTVSFLCGSEQLEYTVSTRLLLCGLAHAFHGCAPSALQCFKWAF